jgi:hypothetical protein
MKNGFDLSGYGMFQDDLKTSGIRSFVDDGGDGSGGGAGDDPPPAAGSGGEDVTGLKNALEAERKARAAMERQFKQLQESIKGIDPNKYKELENLQQQAEQWNQKEAELRTSLETDWTAKVKAEQAIASDFKQKYLNLSLRTEAERAFLAAKGRSGAGEDGITFFDALLGMVEKNLRLNDKGQVEVVDHNGARRFSAKDSTKPMTPHEYFESLVKHPVLGHCFERQSDGRGGGSSASNGAGISGVDLSAMSRTERLALSRRESGN